MYFCLWIGFLVIRGVWFWYRIIFIYDIGVNIGFNRIVSGSFIVFGGVWSDGGVILVVWGSLMVVVEIYDLSDYFFFFIVNIVL